MHYINPYLAEVFPEPPLVAFKRQKNVKDYVIRSKIPPIPTSRPKRTLKGMKKCGKACPACPFILEGKEIKLKKSSWKINSHVNCESFNIIYLIECNKETCKARYIGQSFRPLKKRFSEHIGYIKSIFPTQATGEHFNLPGHSIANAKVTIIEKVKKNNENYRKERETIQIRRFNTFYGGINRQPSLAKTQLVTNCCYT